MATTAFSRRNDPCPCGSGLKYKACHGKLEGAVAPAASPPRVGVEDSIRNGRDALAGNRFDEALAWFDGALTRAPDHAAAIHFKGYALCLKGDFDAGLALVQRGVELDARNADFWNRTGFLRYVAGDLRGAIAALEKAISLAPSMAEAYSNLALALRETGDADRGLAAVRRALELKPDHPQSRINLAMMLLALGRFGEAWPALSWRPDPRINLRDVGVPNAIAHAGAIAPLATDPWITLHAEQGLGDTLFFLRFAPLLRARGAKLRFWGDARLGPMLVRSGVVDESIGARQMPAQLDPARLLWVGDLPSALDVGEAISPPLRLVVDESRRARMAGRLAELGPAPCIALTWRAGLERRGQAVLAKEIAPALLGAALSGARATFVSVQRDPRSGEREALESAIGAKVHDLSGVNSDLEDALALMATVDDYIGVSNTNVHLRAGLGLPARVLVPWPAEWRWTRDAQRSVWFPGMPLYRADRRGDWSDALAALRRDTRA